MAADHGEALGQAETWRVLQSAPTENQTTGTDAPFTAAGTPAPDAEAIRRVWSALDVLAQDRLTAGMIDRIELRHRNSEMRITFKRNVSEALSQVFKGDLRGSC